MSDPTHIVIKDDTLYLSSNLVQIFQFIMNIESEVKSFLTFGEKLESIREQHLELIDLVIHQAKILKKNDVEYPFPFKKYPGEIANDLQYDVPLRSQIIVLFAFLETLRVLWTAYELETDDELKLKNASNEAIDKFIKEFCLTEKNKWYKNNRKRSGKIGVKCLRELRNNLTHFFAVSKLGLIPSFNEKFEEISKKTNYKFQAISPNDLYEIIKSASKIMLETWSKECTDQPEKFQKKIIFVKQIVEKKAPIKVTENKGKTNQ